MSRSDSWSWVEDVLPFVGMLVLTCLDMTALTTVKAAMNDGMGTIVYVVYHNTLGTLILLPLYIIHILRKADRPPLTLLILFRCFILGTVGLCLFEVLWYIGVDYSSPITASAIADVLPGVTFLFAVLFRMEKIDIRSSSSVAKIFGTMAAILGTMVFTLYQGPKIFHSILSPDSSNQRLLAQPSNWILGSIILVISVVFACIWIVLQAATIKEYPDQQTIIFFFCLFGTLQCIVISPFLERNRSAWELQPGIRLTAVLLGAVYTTAFRNTILIWCLRKKGPAFVAMFSPLKIVIAVILAITFLGDSLHLGSVIGAIIVVVGFYAVIWGQTKEKNNALAVVEDDLDVSDEPGSSAPLLSSRNESGCGLFFLYVLSKKINMRQTDHTWSWMDDVVPFVAMLTVTCFDIAMLTITKAAMNDGMDSIVYVVYHNALGTFILLPFLIFHFLRKVGRPMLTFRILLRFFILGLLGICLFQVLWYVGVDYSSPTMASAILNLSPGVTFMIAVFFRTEKIDLKSSSCVAKILGTMIAILGAMVFTFYQSPEIYHKILSYNSPNQPFLSQPSKWILGSLITFTSITFCCIWNVLHTTTAREYPDQQTIVFFYCFFGTIQCIAISPVLVRKQDAWVLRRGIGVTAIVLGAVYSTVVRNIILTWCLRKKGPVFVTMFSPLSIVLAVIMGVTVLGDSLHLGSVIGAMIVVVGFYTVMWGQIKDKNKTLVVMNDEMDVSNEPGSSTDQTVHLLSSRN
ncbi:uncharacterized protein LOC143550735 [Bidens hawaiensis]|uniref:uncharacterized protein LOC143550735 n=1 Tax=Bidens hawaiensis TaxID=980011 RepID=UPI004049D06C